MIAFLVIGVVSFVILFAIYVLALFFVDWLLPWKE